MINKLAPHVEDARKQILGEALDMINKLVDFVNDMNRPLPADDHVMVSRKALATLVNSAGLMAGDQEDRELIQEARMVALKAIVKADPSAMVPQRSTAASINE